MQFIKMRNKLVPKPSFPPAALLMTLMPVDGRELHKSSLLGFSYPRKGGRLKGGEGGGQESKSKERPPVLCESQLAKHRPKFNGSFVRWLIA